MVVKVDVRLTAAISCVYSETSLVMTPSVFVQRRLQRAMYARSEYFRLRPCRLLRRKDA